MHNIKTCLLLGRIKDTLKIKKIIKKKNWKVICKNREININDLKNIDLIIIFNYRHVLKNRILKKIKRPAINLHISYLPYNRGCHPNFWSFIENSPKGITIHEIGKSLDAGPIIYQKRLFFNINKKEHSNFFKTNKILLQEIQKLFFKKVSQLLDKKYYIKKQKKKGTFHYRSEVPEFIKKNWKINIKKVLEIYKKK